MLKLPDGRELMNYEFVRIEYELILDYTPD